MSNLDQVNEIVAQGYDQVFQTYAGLEADDSWPRMRWISKLRVKLQEGAAILDLGCGSGVPADLILSEDFAVSVVDISPKQIELARQKVPNATFEVGDADSAHFDEGLFSAILSFYTLEQIPRQQHGALFAKIFAWLAPGGYLLFSMEAGDIEGVVSEWLGSAMFFSCFDPDTTSDLVREAGFAIVETAIEVQIEQDSEIPYHWVLAQKPA